MEHPKPGESFHQWIKRTAEPKRNIREWAIQKTAEDMKSFYPTLRSFQTPKVDKETSEE